MKAEEAPYGYVIDTRLREKYHEGYERKDSEVTHFIVHGTAGGNSAEDNIRWMLKGGYIGNGVYRSLQYKKGVALFQYIIDRNGKIFEVLNPHRFVYASSTGGNSSKQTGFDRHCIQVECTNPDRNNGGTYNDQQYCALTWLYCFLLERFEKMKYISGHGAIKKEKTGGYKECPGTGFDWHRFNRELVEWVNTTNLKTEQIEVL